MAIGPDANSGHAQGRACMGNAAEAQHLSAKLQGLLERLELGAVHAVQGRSLEHAVMLMEKASRLAVIRNPGA